MVKLLPCQIQLRKMNRVNEALYCNRYSTAGFPLGQGSQGKSENLLEGQGKSGKLEIFWKKPGKSQERKFLSMQFFNFNKKIICTQNCV